MEGENYLEAQGQAIENYPSGHMTFIQSHINMDAMSHASLDFFIETKQFFLGEIIHHNPVISYKIKPLQTTFVFFHKPGLTLAQDL